MYSAWHVDYSIQKEIMAYLSSAVTESFGRMIMVEVEYSPEISTDGWTYFDGDTIFIDYKTDLGMAHELVHAVQILNKRFAPDNQTWDGVEHKFDQPWEDDAYAKEEQVHKEWFNG